jgi:hypothetical protein
MTGVVVYWEGEEGWICHFENCLPPRSVRATNESDLLFFLFFTEPFPTSLVFVIEFGFSKMTSQIFKKTKDFCGIIQLFPDVTDIDAVFGFLCKSNCF